MTKDRLRSFSILASFIIALTSCSNGKQPGETKETETLPDNIVELRDDQAKLAGIGFGAVELRSISGSFKVNGIVAVSPQDMATVCMPMGGFVKSASLMPGSAVNKGQVLAILENQDFVDIQQNYLEAKNKLDFAEAEYRRHTELFKDDVYSKQNLQQVTTEYKNLKAQVRALEQKLALINVNPSDLTEDNIRSTIALYSPISGFVRTVNVNLGKYVSPTDVLFEIVNSNKLFLELTLFEKDADKVKAGQKIHFFINNETEQHEAVIFQTGKSINPDKTYKVYASVSGTCKNILPGMYVNALVEASYSKVTALPSEAIVSFDDKDYIFVFDKNKQENGKPFTEFRIVEVHKGVSDGDYTEIILPEGFNISTSKIVIKGAYNLLSAKKNAGEMSC
jgi:membrane fusion protein, heavy metal efflux system